MGEGKEVMVPVGREGVQQAGAQETRCVGELSGSMEGLCCAHLMGKVKLRTGLLVASGLAKSLCRAVSRHAALGLGCHSCPSPRLTNPVWEARYY